MNRFFPLILLAFTLCFHSCTDRHPDGLKAAPSHPEAMALPGEQLFVQRCAACHGKDGTAGIANAANLQSSALDIPAIKHTIANGRGAMPAFGKMLSGEDIQSLAEYVNGLKKGNPVNNAPQK